MPNKLFNSSLRVLGLENLLCYSRDNSAGVVYVKSQESRSGEEEKDLLREEREKSQRSQEISASCLETSEYTAYHG